jgi:hypothetical protein
MLLNACVKQCPSEYFQSSNQVCIKCQYPCLSCSKSPTTCLSCRAGLLLDNSNCFRSCKFGDYASNGVCKKCDSNCLTCSRNSNNCTSCANGQSLDKRTSTCVSKSGCAETFFYDQSIENCYPCERFCKTCTDTSNCKECKKGYFLKDGDCVTRCGDTFYPDTVNSVCMKCADTNCLKCSSKGCYAYSTKTNLTVLATCLSTPSPTKPCTSCP